MGFPREETNRMSKIEALFQNPTAEWRGKPFWSWNGKLEKEEILRQIDVLEQMGMGGYFCHSRTGLITEYLGDEWFDLINASADRGKEKGMETWLYDEDRLAQRNSRRGCYDKAGISDALSSLFSDSR